MSSQKGLAPIVIVLLIAAALGGYLIYQNQSKSVTTPAEQTETSKVDEAGDWETFTNKKYGYSFKYPDGMSPYSDVWVPAEESPLIETIIFHKMTPEYQGPEYVQRLFSVEAHDPKVHYKGSPFLKTISLPLLQFAQEIWDINKNEEGPTERRRIKKVGHLTETTLDNHRAFKFSLTATYGDARGGYVLDEEYTYFLTEKGGIKYIIRFPSQGQIFKTMLSTFKFVE